MATRNSEALRLIGVARGSGSTHDFWQAKQAVNALPPSQAKNQYRAAVRQLPLSDPATWMVARAVEVTLDMNQNVPEVVDGGDGYSVVTLRRSEMTFSAGEGQAQPATLEATAVVDAESGALAVSRLAVTSYDPQIGVVELPIADGRLDVQAVRAMDENLRRVCAVPAALIAPPQL